MKWNQKIARAVGQLLGWREDAYETAVLARQLDYVQAETYRVEYDELKARRFIPTAGDVPVGAKTFTYRQWDRFGMANVIHDYANDFKSVGVFAKEFTQKCEDVGDFYEYSLHDLEAAALSNTPLDSEMANAARMAIELAIDNIAAIGDPESGLPGFVNFENVPLVALPNGDWQNVATTTEEILEDMRFMAAAQVDNTHELHPPDTMILDPESFELVAGRAVGQNLDRTILSVFLATNPHIRSVEQWRKLTTAGADGGPRIMCYQRNPRVVQLQIPREFTQLPVQQLAAMFRTYCLARVGGVSWRLPLAAAYADNAA